MKNKGHITFEKDIFKEVSEELGIPLKKVEEAYYINNRYIRYLADHSDFTGILLPNLGTLYIKYSHVLDYIRSIAEKNLTENNDKYKQYLKRKEKMMAFYNNSDRSKRAYIKNFMSTLISKMKRQIRTDDIGEVEKVQNNYYEKER